MTGTPPGAPDPADLPPAVTGWRSWVLAEAARPRRVAAYRGAHWLAVGTVCFGAFMGQLDASIVTLTFPALRTQFGASLAGVQWVSLAYLLALVALLAPTGRLSDAGGRKRWYLNGFALFTVASALCGFAGSLGLLVGFRVLQALGACMLQANSVALVATSVPRPLMRKALGVQAAAQALGLALGPTIGGVLVSSVGWRWVFFVNIPVGVAGIVAGHYLLPRTRVRAPAGRFDWAGLVLLAACTTAALLALSSVSGLDLSAFAGFGLLAVMAAAGAAFLWRQRRASAPLIDLRMFADRVVGGGIAAALGGYLILFGPLVLVPVVMIDVGSSAWHAGLVATALPVGFAAGATVLSWLLPAGWTSRRRCTTGASLAAAALAVLVVTGFAVGSLIVFLFVLGAGIGLFTPANNHQVMAAVPPAAAGTGGGALNMARSLGTALGVAIVTYALHAGSAQAGERFAFAALGLAAVAVIALSVWSGRMRPDGEGMRAPGA